MSIELKVARAGGVPNLSDALLKLRTRCGFHGREYIASMMRDGHIENSMCPDCTKDMAWAMQAYRELQDEKATLTDQSILDRAVKLAGHRLLRYQPRG